MAENKTQYLNREPPLATEVCEPSSLVIGNPKKRLSPGPETHHRSRNLCDEVRALNEGPVVAKGGFVGTSLAPLAGD
jgi:hypothetical protein